MHAILQVSVAVKILTLTDLIWNRAAKKESKTSRNSAISLKSFSRGSGTIPDQVPAHVLEDDLTMVVWVTTRVLVGPLDGENRAFVVVEAAHVVSSAVVVLGIVKPTV